MISTTLAVVFAALVLLPSQALAQSGPVISRVVFRGGAGDPEVIVYGHGFGRRPAPLPSGGTSNLGKCGRINGWTGSDYGRKLWIDDHTQLWSAGYLPLVDCMGLIVTRYTDDKVVYRLGSFYRINYLRRNGFAYGVYDLAADDNITVHVNGASYATQVRYAGQYVSYAAPGSYVWTVPASVRRAAFDLFGATGGGGGGEGGYVHAVLRVHPGETLTILVGGRGQAVSQCLSGLPQGGFNGGGTGGFGGPSGIGGCGGSGGGASDVRTGPPDAAGLLSRLLVAGGGGSAGQGGKPGTSGGPPYGGGGGTATSGGSGGSRTAYQSTCPYGGRGGTVPGGAGVLGMGGAGGAGDFYAYDEGPSFDFGGGGGGGGLYGGGGGAGSLRFRDCHVRYNIPEGGGGGGSSYATPQALCRPFFQTGVQSGDGAVEVTYNPPRCPRRP